MDHGIIALLDRIAEGGNKGIIIADNGGQIRYVDNETEKILGMTHENADHRKASVYSLPFTDCTGAPLLREDQPFSKVIASRKSLRSTRLVIDRPCINRRSISIDALPILDEAGDVESVVLMLETIDNKGVQNTGPNEAVTDETSDDFDTENTREGEEEDQLGQRILRSALVDVEELDLSKIIDVPQIRSIMDDFSRLTGIGHAILDIKGNVITSSGWSEICANFHRADKVARESCRESDLHLSENLQPGEIRSYKCKNNLWDFVTPLYIGDIHVCNVYTGQFFLDEESIDEAIFIAQAERYGFDKEAYLDALRKVPKYSRDMMNDALDFMIRLTRFISELSYANLKLANALIQQERTEKDLRIAEERYRSIYEGTPTGLYRITARGDILEANTALIHMLGYDDLESLRSVSIYDLYVDPGLRDEWMSGTEHENAVQDFVFQLRRSDGTTIWVHDTSRAVRDDHGEITHYEGNLRDITEIKRAEEELRERDDRVRKIASNLPGMIYQFLKRPDGTYCIPFSSEAINELFGCSPKDVQDDANPVFKMILREDLKGMIDSIEYSAKHLTPWQHEHRVQIPGQPIRWMWGNATPERLSDGSMIWHGFSTDVSDRKKAEEELKESEERYRRLTENAPDIIYRIRLAPDMQIEFVSSAIETILGYTPQEVIEDQTIFINSIHPEDRGSVIEQLELSDNPPGSGSLQIRMRHRNGETIWCEIRFIRIFDSSGKRVASEGILRDVTARVKAEQELKHRKESAEAATMKAQTYLDFIAHDLTNILSPMMIYAEMIAKDEQSQPWIRSSATKIMNQIKRTASFVRNTRRLSESEKTHIRDMEVIDLVDALRSKEQDLQRDYPSKRFVFNHNLPKGGTISIRGREYILQMIDEILNNSAKHSKSDDVRIDIDVAEVKGSADFDYWRVEISDNGPGIQDMMKAGMEAESFDPENRFSRGIASSLSFMSLIAEHIGGRMRIQDRVQGDHTKGTKIVLMLPKEKEQNRQGASDEKASQS